MSGSNNGGNARLDRIEKLIEQTVRATKDAERADKEAHPFISRRCARFGRNCGGGRGSA